LQTTKLYEDLLKTYYVHEQVKRGSFAAEEKITKSHKTIPTFYGGGYCVVRLLKSSVKPKLAPECLAGALWYGGIDEYGAPPPHII
jgi:hypothetical protein